MRCTPRGMQYTRGYQKYTARCSVHWQDIMSTLGDTIIIVEKVVDKIVKFVWKHWCAEHPSTYSRHPYIKPH